MCWILERSFDDQVDLSNVKDLEKDWIVVWQAKLYLPLLIISDILVPFGIGWVYHQATGQESIYAILVLAGLLRFILNYHITFFINSVRDFLAISHITSKTLHEIISFWPY